MRTRTDKTPSALRHGAYSAIAVLPGEDRSEFTKLHHGLIADLVPSGALEHDIVANMARLMWRRNHLATLRTAELAANRFDEALQEEYLAKLKTDPVERDRVDKAISVAADQVESELGIGTANLVLVREAANLDRFDKELALAERIDTMIDRCLKRLLFVRGLKSVSASLSPASSTRRKLIKETSKVA